MKSLNLYANELYKWSFNLINKEDHVRIVKEEKRKVPKFDLFPIWGR